MQSLCFWPTMRFLLGSVAQSVLAIRLSTAGHQLSVAEQTALSHCGLTVDGGAER